MHRLLLFLAPVLLLACVPSSQAFYVQSCHYFGPHCGHKIGDLEATQVLANFSVDVRDSQKNISCGLSTNESIEYCSLPPEFIEEEPDPNRHQCFSLYRLFADSNERFLVASGCIFGHGLNLCTGHQCNFSHDTQLAHSNDSLHYCCCHSSDFCNGGRIVGHPPSVKPGITTLTFTSSPGPMETTSETESGSSSMTLIVLAILLPVVVICISILAGTWYWSQKRRSMLYGHETLVMDTINGHVAAPAAANREQPPQVSGELEVFRKYGSVIGCGRFSNVHKGELDGEEVAIKVFGESDIVAWQNEWRIYNTLRVQHQNILYFRGAKEVMNGPVVMERYLVTEYHSNGSLSDYLKRTTITYQELCIKAVSIARGLEFLHTQKSLRDFIPPYTKPTIAHRDFKSKNILVKTNRECCVSDFGLATSFGVNESLTERQGKVGTTRYMAPEVLEGAITFQMESFLRIDIYAFALVMWELITRCNFNGVPAQEYREPFVDEVGQSATQMNMLRCVVTKKERPRFPPHCVNHQRLEKIVGIVAECWDPDPEARLSAQCFLDNLMEVIEDPGLKAEDDDAMPTVNIPPMGKDNEPDFMASITTGRSQYDAPGQNGSTSGPPAYSSGNFGHDGVPNVLIRENADYHEAAGTAPPPEYDTFTDDSTSHYREQQSQQARMPNGGPHRYNNHGANHDVGMSSMSSQGPAGGHSAHSAASYSNGHVPNGHGHWNNSSSSGAGASSRGNAAAAAALPSMSNHVDDGLVSASSQLPARGESLSRDARSPSANVQESSL
ncbi:activin receptor type-2A-like isoform X2 [Sycon ciliatum]|uniref:activin receptor type-2A-like isoform X2 n=1 Tax=Sycon ciliatum TaxID=27933 RepID=UPI0031F60864